MSFPMAFTPWAWAIAAVVVGFLELHVPGSYLIWIACAAALTAAAAFAVDLSYAGQLLTFVIACAFSCGVGFFVYRRAMSRRHREPALNRRDLDLVGAAGTAAEAFTGGRGRARIGDSVWLAEAKGDIPAGAPLVVKAVRGTVLVVEATAGRQ